ncbi:HTTM domain-containing protein [Haloarcula salinisoli]|uniref:HTTM domain-containing protein n=1 Tax=Haloarcula salinisoli TaxID=2487746 RepID=UPI002E2BBE97|nr:HTTM domain-containing protein [Halomicroarcula salinisoli]
MTERLDAVRAAIARRLAIDRRALAAFRVALALVVLVDLARRLPDVRAFYTDAGVLPRSVLATLYPGYGAVSLHALSGGLVVQLALFALAGVAALALLVGYRTRLATVVSLVLLVSLQLRNPLVLNSGDVLLRRLLFWAAFLPLGSRWAVDSGERTNSSGATDRVVGLATAGLLAQVVVVYLTNAVVKFRADVWLRGDAVRYAFQLDHFTVLLGDVIAGWTPAVQFAAWLWLALLVCSPLLVVLTGRARAALVGAFAAIHAGMVVTMQLGVFPLVSLAGLVPLLPGWVWDRVEARVPVTRRLPRLPRTPLARRVPALTALARTLAALCLVALVVVNAVGLGVVGAPAGTPDQVTERSWDMFAPSPPRATWWVLAPANLTSGERVNAITGEPFDASRPPEVAEMHRNERWRKFFADAKREPQLRQSLARHLCTRWNRTHDSGMTDVQLWHMSERTDLDGPESVERERLGSYRCGAT